MLNAEPGAQKFESQSSNCRGCEVRMIVSTTSTRIGMTGE